jgi:hypothetical protein
MTSVLGEKQKVFAQELVPACKDLFKEKVCPKYRVEDRVFLVKVRNLCMVVESEDLNSMLVLGEADKMLGSEVYQAYIAIWREPSNRREIWREFDIIDGGRRYYTLV